MGFLLLEAQSEAFLECRQSIDWLIELFSTYFPGGIIVRI